MDCILFNLRSEICFSFFFCGNLMKWICFRENKWLQKPLLLWFNGEIKRKKKRNGFNSDSLCRAKTTKNKYSVEFVFLVDFIYTFRSGWAKYGVLQLKKITNWNIHCVLLWNNLFKSMCTMHIHIRAIFCLLKSFRRTSNHVKCLVKFQRIFIHRFVCYMQWKTYIFVWSFGL